MVLMPLVSLHAAQAKVGRMHRAISELPAVYHPSFSYGIVEVKAGTDLNISQILRLADQEMYRFKQARHKERPTMAPEDMDTP